MHDESSLGARCEVCQGTGVVDFEGRPVPAAAVRVAAPESDDPEFWESVVRPLSIACRQAA